jgi:hypothetical protein
MDTTALVRGDALDGPTATADGTETTRRALAPTTEVARQAMALVIALLATVPLATITVLWHSRGGADDLNRSVVFAPFDLVLVLATVWAVAHLRAVRDLFHSPAVRFVSLAYVVLFATSLAAHPSWLGLALAARLGAGVAILAAVVTALGSATTRTITLAAITVVGVAQAALAMGQSLHHVAFGIEYVDFAGKLYPFGSSYAGRGGLTHPYHLAVLLGVAEAAALLGYRGACRATGRAHRSRWLWIGAIAVMTVGMGVTYSRSAVIGQVILVVAALASRRDRRALLPVVAAVLVGLAIGMSAFGNGWVAKSAQTTNSSQVDSNRRVRIEESIQLMRSNPAVGVGPGRYVAALDCSRHDECLPAHDLVAQEGAELGVLGYVVTAGLLALLGLRAWRGGSWTFAVVGPMLPFLVLDAYPYVFATGLALSAVWLGLVHASLRPEPTS